MACPFNYAWKRIAHRVPLIPHVLSKASPVSRELYHVRQDAGKESRHDAASSRRYSDVTDVVIDDDTLFFATLHHPIGQKETITPVGPLSGTNLSAAFQLNSLPFCRQTALRLVQRHL